MAVHHRVKKRVRCFGIRHLPPWFDQTLNVKLDARQSIAENKKTLKHWAGELKKLRKHHAKEAEDWGLDDDDDDDSGDDEDGVSGDEDGDGGGGGGVSDGGDGSGGEKDGAGGADSEDMGVEETKGARADVGAQEQEREEGSEVRMVAEKVGEGKRCLCRTI